MLVPVLQRPFTAFWRVGLTVPLLLRCFMGGSCSLVRGILSLVARGGGEG